MSEWQSDLYVSEALKAQLIRQAQRVEWGSEARCYAGMTSENWMNFPKRNH